MQSDLVQVITHDPTVRGIVRNSVAKFAANNDGAWIAWRVIRWLLLHPFGLAGLIGAVWLMAHGVPWWLAAFAGCLPHVAWAGRELWRLLVSASRRQNNRGWRQWPPEPWTVLRGWRAIRKGWPTAARATRFIQPGRGGQIPLLRHWSVTNAGLAVWVTPGAFGWTADELARESETIAACVKKCWSVDVTPGETPGVAQLDFRFRDPLAELVPFTALPAPLLGRLTLGINDQGDPVYIFNHLSILIVGQLGSGKSNALWNIIMQALAQPEPFSLWVIDPSGGVELHALSLGSPIVTAYASEARPIRNLIRRLHREMLNRMRGMAGKTRFHTPTVEEPRWYLVIDEMVRLGNILDREDNDLLIEILSMCRKAGITVVALTQIPFAHTMGEKVRLLFPQKVVFRANDLMITNSLFGAGAEALGAKASKIPAGLPGIAYAVFEKTNRPMRLRGPAQDENSISLISQGIVPDGVAISEGFIGRDIRNVPHVVYQFITDEGEILYIGISNDGTRRLAEHLSSDKRERILQPDCSWRPLITLTAETCAPEIAAGKTVRDVAEEIEKTLIQEHQPAFNIAHAGNGKKRRGRKTAPPPAQAPPPEPEYWVEQVVDEEPPDDGPRAITDGTSG